MISIIKRTNFEIKELNSNQPALKFGIGNTIKRGLNHTWRTLCLKLLNMSACR